jgi:hypothetical protein
MSLSQSVLQVQPSLRSFAPVRRVLGLPPLPPAWSRPARDAALEQGTLF